jgi:hypothetical protein
MNISIQFATGLILAASAVVVSGNIAHAGEAGAAGSIAAQFGTVSGVANTLTDLSGAVAVGKAGAATAARTTDNGDTFASAVGGAGTLKVTGANTPNVGYTAADDTNLGTAQANNLTDKATLKFTNNVLTSGIVIP